MNDKVSEVLKKSFVLAASGVKVNMAVELAAEKQGVILTPQEKRHLVETVTLTVFRLGKN